MLESLFNKVAHMLSYDLKFSRAPIFQSLLKIKQRFCVNKLGKQHTGDSRKWVHWHFTKHFSELSYYFFLKSKGRIFYELRVSLNKMKNLLFFNLLLLYLKNKRVFK